MTTLQVHFFNALYFLALIATAYFTRATPRRIAGACVGGAVVSVVLLGIVLLGEKTEIWHFNLPWEPYFLLLFYLGGVISCAFVYLLTWRIARRFGLRGMAVLVALLAVLGPFRDRWYMRTFPEWGSYGPGMAPMLAISATYVTMIALGHTIMDLVAGPSRGSPLARRWGRTELGRALEDRDVETADAG
jgi:hypothetical protein